ncbi:hypothetical protein CHPC873_0033 [Streptococcus phage CHPC873]|uniref:Uncharacterized protein n=1 Tax=Streptococcus phage CHPC873 TaxID=2365042 RepID=A0A3G8F777_9CAUD|nr:hypothetical protein PP211_gp33 [Streptococcus phage CHPC873]AZF90636.1 hypothetical protein CHPC873_0033 [Streptococcus phage CHPC873]
MGFIYIYFIFTFGVFSCTPYIGEWLRIETANDITLISN